jgi:hypothetical protein
MSSVPELRRDRMFMSAGVTRFPRCYEPLRHPTAPARSSQASGSSSLTSLCGASRVACAFLIRMLPALTGRSGRASSSLVSPRRISLPR